MVKSELFFMALRISKLFPPDQAIRESIKGGLLMFWIIGFGSRKIRNSKVKSNCLKQQLVDSSRKYNAVS